MSAERFSCEIVVSEYRPMGDRDDKRLVVGASGKGKNHLGAFMAAVRCFARMEGKSPQELLELAEREQKIASDWGAA